MKTNDIKETLHLLKINELTDEEISRLSESMYSIYISSSNKYAKLVENLLSFIQISSIKERIHREHRFKKILNSLTEKQSLEMKVKRCLSSFGKKPYEMTDEIRKNIGKASNGHIDSKETKMKRSTTIKRLFKHGYKVWNDGLTAETDKRVFEYGRKTSATQLKSEVFQKATRSPEKAKKISERKKGRAFTEEHKDNISRSKTGFRVYTNKNRFKYYSKKGDCYIRVDSSYELAACLMLEEDPFVKSFKRFTKKIKYEFNGYSHNHLPDFIIEYYLRPNEIIEIKPKSQVHYPVNVEKEFATYAYCMDNGYTYNIWTEDIIFKNYSRQYCLELYKALNLISKLFPILFGFNSR